MAKPTQEQEIQANSVIEQVSDALVSMLITARDKGYVTLSFKKTNDQSGNLLATPTEKNISDRLWGEHSPGDAASKLTQAFATYTDISAPQLGRIAHVSQVRAAVKLGLFTPKEM